MYCTIPCTIFDLHHTLDLVIHHACTTLFTHTSALHSLHHSHSAPHCTTLACTTFALHYATTSSLHYTCPAPRCTNALYHTRLHTMAIRPAPQPPCTILNHTRLHHTPELHSPCTTPTAPHRTTPYTIPCMIFREGISHIVRVNQLDYKGVSLHRK